MPSERVLLAVLLTAFGLALVLAYLGREFRSYRTHRDARALRGFVAAFTVLFLVFAVIGRSPTLRENFLADWPLLFGFLTTSGLSGALAGIGFLAFTGGRRRRDHEDDTESEEAA